MEIQGYADGSWPKLIDADEVEKITGASKEIILDYAKAGLCPHVIVARKDIFFIKKHILRWIKENLLDVCEGVELAPVPVLVKEPCQWSVPNALAMVADRLIEVPQISGIYFLVHDGKVIYVGQSINVATRILGHKNKTYDRALVLPCARQKLNEVESAFIGFFKPILNMNQDETKFIYNDKHAFDNPEIVVGEILQNNTSRN